MNVQDIALQEQFLQQQSLVIHIDVNLENGNPLGSFVID